MKWVEERIKKERKRSEMKMRGDREDRVRDKEKRRMRKFKIGTEKEKGRQWWPKSEYTPICL